MDPHTHDLAERIWNYHRLNHVLVPADVILVLCSHDTSVARRGAQLALEGWAPVLIFSGGLGSITRQSVDRAGGGSVRRDRARDGHRRRPDPDREPLDQHGREHQLHAGAARRAGCGSADLHRRSEAIHGAAQLRDVQSTLAGQDGAGDVAASLLRRLPRQVLERLAVARRRVSIMVGDLQRVRVYPARGFQIPQDIPDDVWARLRGAGRGRFRPPPHSSRDRPWAAPFTGAHHDQSSRSLPRLPRAARVRLLRDPQPVGRRQRARARRSSGSRRWPPPAPVSRGRSAGPTTASRSTSAGALPERGRQRRRAGQRRLRRRLRGRAGAASPPTSPRRRRRGSPGCRSRTRRATPRRRCSIRRSPSSGSAPRAGRSTPAAAGVLLTGRSEGFIAGRPDLTETIRRLIAYADAGADCLHAPGLRSPEDIAAVVRAVAPKPVNVLVWSGFTTVASSSDLGVRRISVGGALARAAWTGFLRAATDIARTGHLHRPWRERDRTGDEPPVRLTTRHARPEGRAYAGVTAPRELRRFRRSLWRRWKVGPAPLAGAPSNQRRLQHAEPPRPRQEGSIRDLPLEPCTPAAGNRGPAAGARAGARDPVVAGPDSHTARSAAPGRRGSACARDPRPGPGGSRHRRSAGHCADPIAAARRSISGVVFAGSVIR